MWENFHLEYAENTLPGGLQKAAADSISNVGKELSQL